MKALRSLFVFCLLSGIFCQLAKAQYVWRHKACLPAPGRNANAFTVGNCGYIFGGAGLNYQDSTHTGPEIWMYNPVSNSWLQKNAFPGADIAIAVFVINDTAYAGTGYDTLGNFHTDFWKYNAGTDQWSRVADFTGAPRFNPMAFAINGKGYVGCGKNNGGYFNDFYEYDPVANAWSQKANFPGAARENGFAFAVGSYGYLGNGYAVPPVFNDCYRYDPSVNSWSPIADFPGNGLVGNGGFVLNDTLYIAGGSNGPNSHAVDSFYYAQCWRYDIVNNDWIQQQGFGCIAKGRSTNNGFVLNGHGYIFGGDDSTYAFNDLLEFGPPDTTFIDRVYVLGNDTTYCGNFLRTLSVADSCALWSTGYIGSGIAVDTAGSYWVTFNDSCGMSTDTISIKSEQIQLEIAINGDTLTVLNPGTYQWYYNGNPIPGAIMASYAATQSGFYLVQVTDNNGCVGKSSSLQVTTGLYDINADAITIYPNPTSTAWQLTVSAELIGSTAQVFDATGQLVFQSPIGNQKSSIALPNAATGVYELRITSNQYSAVRKLVKM